jgi:prephenate dehydrogenase
VEAAATAGEAIRGADLIVLAAPPQDCLDLLVALAGPLAADVAADAVITDVASTKALIVERAAQIGLRFVGGHPMAGRETPGYGNADPALFQNRPWIIVPAAGADAAAIGRIEALAQACGARPLRMGATDHDVAVALISHAPLVVSAALIEAAAGRPEWPLAASIAASGWVGMTRLAKGEPEMGAGILATNRIATANALRAFGGVIDAWIALLERGGDAAELRARLESARSAATDAP